MSDIGPDAVVVVAAGSAAAGAGSAVLLASAAGIWMLLRPPTTPALAALGSSRMCDQIGFVGQCGGEFLDDEGSVEASAQFVRINEQADLSGLACK